MKRTNLVLDVSLLETVTKLLGEKTYSAAVNKAMQETIKLIKLRNLKDYFGTNVWEGNLSEMRGDAPKKKNTIKRTRSKR